MKKEEIMKSVSTTFGKVSVKLKKHSPEILVVAGVVGTVASAVMACHATTKLDSVLEKSKKDIDAIHKCAENEKLADEYSKDDAKKDLAIVYVQAGVKVARLYAPSVALGTLSIASIVTAIVEGREKATSIENVTTAIAAVTEAYPELKSNENYKELMNELSITENLIAEYRENYNKQIKEYNRYVRKFPTRFFLNILGYETQQYQYLDYGAPVDAPQNLFGD